MEESDRVTAATDAGNETIWQPAFCRQNLASRFTPNDGLEITDHHRIGMSPEH